MKTLGLLLPILVYCSSCTNDGMGGNKKNEEAFDKSRWLVKEKKQYPYRNKMLNDLIENQKLKGIKKSEVLNLLGEPDRQDSNYIFYTVDQQLLGDLLPLHTKTLVIKFVNDTVAWRKIHK